MKKYSLNSNQYNDYNRRKKAFLTTTALFTAFSIFCTASEYKQQVDLQEQIRIEQEQQAELQRQLEELRIQGYQNYYQAMETAYHNSCVQQEAENIEQYYSDAQEIMNQSVYIDTDLNWTDGRRENCEEYYGEAIDEIAPKFGFSPNVIRAIATQEGGGKLENVMQVAEGWKYQRLKYYDYELDKWMYLCVKNGEQENTDDTIYISTDDPNWSVYLGCVLFQQAVQYNNGHLFAGFTHYNRGDATPLVNTVAASEGMTHDEYLEDTYNAAIQYYEYNCYILYVLQFMDEAPVVYKYYNEDTNQIEEYTVYMTFQNRDIQSIIKDELGNVPYPEYQENMDLFNTSEKEYQQEVRSL